MAYKEKEVILMHTFFNDAFAAAYAACTGKMLVLEPENSTDATINYNGNVTSEPIRIMNR